MALSASLQDFRRQVNQEKGKSDEAEAKKRFTVYLEKLKKEAPKS